MLKFNINPQRETKLFFIVFKNRIIHATAWTPVSRSSLLIIVINLFTNMPEQQTQQVPVAANASNATCQSAVLEFDRVFMRLLSSLINFLL